jgi:hypothetical protein
VVTGDVARELAESELAEVLPRRWRHVQAVAAQAERLLAIPGVAGQILVAAAWLHDIGYAPDLHDTGFHPIDGGRFLRKLGADDRLVCLVAHHSCAVYEARVRGLEDVLLAEFPREASVTYDALVFCDLTTGPAGQPVTYMERMKEIKNRYGPDHEVSRALELSEADLSACCERTLARLADLQLTVSAGRHSSASFCWPTAILNPSSLPRSVWCCVRSILVCRASGMCRWFCRVQQR